MRFSFRGKGVRPGFISGLRPLLLVLLVGWTGGAAVAATAVVAWGSNVAGQTNVPPGLGDVVAVAGGLSHSVALTAGGKVVVWGSNASGQTNLPPNLSGVVGVAAGHSHSLALTADGSVVAWGLNNVGQTFVPPGLTNVIAVAAGNGHNMALLRNGQVVVWGANLYGQTNVPTGLADVAAICSGLNHCLAVLGNGTVIAWGNNAFGQSTVPDGLSNVVAVAGGGQHSLALRQDGVVVAWGGNTAGQATVPAPLAEPGGALAIAAGSSHSLALRPDGTVMVWGANTTGQTNLPSGLSHVGSIAAGHQHSLAVTGDAVPRIVNQPVGQSVYSGGTVTLSVTWIGFPPVTFQWRKDGVDLAGATNARLTLVDVQPGDAGAYSVRLTGQSGFVLSVGARVEVLTSVPIILEPPADQVVTAGGLARFRVRVDGSRPFGYQWRFEGQAIAGATGPGLDLTNVMMDATGGYTVVVNNPFGAVTSAVARLVVTPGQLPGTFDPSFDPGLGPDDVVRVVTRLGDGSMLIGGWFNSVGGVSRTGIARITAGGSWDLQFPAGAGPDGPVLAIAVQGDGRILIGGDFLNVNGMPRARVARLQADGSVDVSFNPESGPNGTVWALGSQLDGRIWIAGDFQIVAGVSMPHVGRLNATGGVDSTFVPTGGPNAPVRALVVAPDGRALIGGFFTGVNGEVRGRIARLEANGMVDLSFTADGGADGAVNVIVQHGDAIWVGGFFSSIAGVSRGWVARLFGDGRLDRSFDPGPGPNSGVSDIAVQPDGRVVLGGGFTTVNGRPRGRLARFQSDGRLDSIFEFNPGADNWIEAVELEPDGRIVIGGAFLEVNGHTRPRVARVLGADPAPFAPVIITPSTNLVVDEGVDSTLVAKAVGFPEVSYRWLQDGQQLIGATNEVLVMRNIRGTNAGIYSIVASNAVGQATGLVAVLAVRPAATHPGTPDLDFFTGGVGGSVNSLIVRSDGRILLGGGFSEVNGVPRMRLARLLPGGALDPDFVSSVPNLGLVRSLAEQPDRRIVVGGYVAFSVVRLLENGAFDSSFLAKTDPFDFVESVALQADGRIVLGGGASRDGPLRLRRLEANGIVDSNFVFEASAGSIRAVLVEPTGRILVGGTFAQINSVGHRGIARLTAGGQVDPSFNPGAGANGEVNAILRQPDGRILIAGLFSRINSVPRNRVARLHTDGTLDASFDPGPAPDNQVRTIAMDAAGRILLGGAFDLVNGVSRKNVARLNPDGSLDLTFDPGTGPDEPVSTMVSVAGYDVLIGGDFWLVNGVPRAGVARLRGGGAPFAQAPVILVPPTNQVVPAGADLTLAVLASGEPLPSYQWQFNGQDILGATNWVLTRSNVRSSSGGNYRVTVSNARGVVSSGDAVVTIAPASRRAGAVDIEFYAGTGPNDRVETIVPLADGRMVIGGSFTEIAGLAAGRLARLEHSGWPDPTFAASPGADGPVHVIARQADGRLVVGGAFASVNGVPRPFIARLNSDGTVDPSFDPGLGPNGTVSAVVVAPEGRIFIGGAFSFVGGSAHFGVARLLANGMVDETFGSAFRANTFLTALDRQSDGRLLVSGGLWFSNGVFTTMLRLLDSGQPDLLYQGSLNYGIALSIAIQPGDQALVGGTFVTAGAQPQPRWRVARLEPTGALDLGFNPAPGASNTVRSVTAARDGRVLIGGDFTGVSGQPFRRIARLLTNGVIDLEFNPGSGVTDGPSQVDEYGDTLDLTAVYAVEVESGGGVLIGGDFTRVDGITRPGIARLYDREQSSAIEIRARPGGVELRWEIGVLQQAIDPGGLWIDVPGATSAYVVPAQGVARFYRLRLN